MRGKGLVGARVELAADLIDEITEHGHQCGEAFGGEMGSEIRLNGSNSYPLMSARVSDRDRERKEHFPEHKGFNPLAHGYTLANRCPADNQAKPAFHFRNQALTHVPRISLRYCPASHKRINAIRLSHPSLHENPRFNQGGTCSRNAEVKAGA
jgi:hypothetical protein